MTSTQHSEGEDGGGQAQPVASAPAPLAVADRGEHDRAPAAQSMRLGKRAHTLVDHVECLPSDRGPGHGDGFLARCWRPGRRDAITP